MTMPNAYEAAVFLHSLEDAEACSLGGPTQVQARLDELGREVLRMLRPAISELEHAAHVSGTGLDTLHPRRHPCIAAWERVSPKMPELSRLLGEVISDPERDVTGTQAELAAWWYVRLARHLHGETEPEPWASILPEGYAFLERIADACEALPQRDATKDLHTLRQPSGLPPLTEEQALSHD